MDDSGEAERVAFLAAVTALASTQGCVDCGHPTHTPGCTCPHKECLCG